MSDVERVRVGDLLKLERRAVVVDPAVEYTEIGVRSFGKGLFRKAPTDGAAIGGKRVFYVKPGDLVLSNVFAWEGAVAVASEDSAGCIGSHRFMTFVPIYDRLDAGWARWFFLSEAGLALIGKASPGSAGRNKTLAVKRFQDLVIPLPPIDEQRRVAAHLDHARARAETVSALGSKADALRHALAPSLASQPQVPEEVKSAAGWRRATLRSVMTQSVDRVSVDRAQEYPNIGIYSFGRGVFPKPPISGASTSATSLFGIRAGQFIYSRLFAFEGAYATVPERFDGYFVSNEFPSFDADPDQLDPGWLAGYLRDPERWADLGASSTGLGVRRQRVPIGALLDLSVLLPPVAQQRRVADSMERIAAAGRHADAVTARAAAIVPSLLNREFATLPM